MSNARRKTFGRELDWIREQAGDLPLNRFEVQHVDVLMEIKGGPTAANTVKKNLWHPAPLCCPSSGFWRPRAAH